MKDDIFNFESDSDDNQEDRLQAPQPPQQDLNLKLKEIMDENEEENYSSQAKNSPSSSNDKKNKEFLILETLVDALLNSKTKSKYDPTYVTDMAFSLKNKDRFSNFEKRAKNEETLYGWFIPDENDEELFYNMINRLKEKGLEKKEYEIMVSPPDDYNIDCLFSVIICKFILGKNVGLNREKELSAKDKEHYLKENYDTVIRVNDNIHTQNPPKRYNVLKKENIELLYFVQLKII